MTDEKRIELLPCPWCGSTNITVEWEPCPPLDATDTNRRWFAECTQCSCQGPFCQKEPEVVKAWNTRATPKPTEAGATPRCEELKRDRERLDWLQENFQVVDVTLDGRTERAKARHHGIVTELNDLRAAIDAAIAQAKANG